MTRRGLRLALVLALAAIAIGPAAVVRAGQSPAKLPDLAMLPPFSFRIDATTQPGRRLLRFSTVQVNVGEGRFKLMGHAADGHADPGEILSVVQWIKREDGTWTQRNTTARMSWSGDGHDHWHLVDFQKFKLVSLKSDTLGNVAKTGFCAFDSYPYTSPRPAFFTSERDICQTNSNGRVLMGTSRGWGDIYKWSIAFQWIDITGLPGGRYIVRSTVDISDWYRETDDYDNCRWARIRIPPSGGGVTVLDSGGGCGEDAITPAKTFAGATSWDPERSISLQPGSYTGYTFNRLGTELRSKTDEIGKVREFDTVRRSQIPGRSGRWFYVKSGPWDGYWLRDTSRIELLPES